MIFDWSNNENKGIWFGMVPMMMLGAAKGDTIEIRATGDGVDAVMPKLVGLVMDGFGED